MQKTQYPQAETHLKTALQQLPEDYTALVMMAKCQVAQEKPHEALSYAEQAKHLYPTEAQGHQMSGIAYMMNDKPSRAYEDFSHYETLLPGNPNIVFFKGLALEEMQMTQEAANEYRRYLQIAPKGEQADYVRKKLATWKY
jgi:predicted Zn-dependent protease